MAAQKYMVERIARVCHEANRAVQIISDDKNVSLPWEQTSEEVRDGAMTGVKFALEDSRTPEEMHTNWCIDKINAGWKFGERKDAELKTHPCLIDYGHLPEEQRLKDRVFIGIVRSFQEHAEIEGLFGL